jgi:Mce-associated membrane protein
MNVTVMDDEKKKDDDVSTQLDTPEAVSLVKTDHGATGAQAQPKGPGPVRRGLAWARGHLLSVVAALVVLGLGVGLVLTTVALRHERALDDARASALEAGRESAIALSSYNHTTLDRDFGAVTSRSTATFRDSFNQTSASLRTVLEQYDATATSTVVAAGVTSASEDRAVVLVFLNQVATNTNQKAGPTTDQSRIEVTLARPDDRWLIDGVKLL